MLETFSPLQLHALLSNQLPKVVVMEGWSEADQNLFHAVIAQDFVSVGRALKDGADPDQRWSSTPWAMDDGYSIPASPLNAAICFAALMKNEVESLPSNIKIKIDEEGHIVQKLLKAGAEPSPEMASCIDPEYFPWMETSRTVILDRLQAGTPIPGTVITLAERLREEQNKDALDGSELWLHLAITSQRQEAVQHWFEQGGVVGTMKIAGALSKVWELRLDSHGSPSRTWPLWESMMTSVRDGLIRDPSDAVYRQEVIHILALHAQFTCMHQSTDPVMQRCATWMGNLLQERPLSFYHIDPAEDYGRSLTRTEEKHVQALLNRYEGEILQEATSNTVASNSIVPRARL